MKFKANRIAVDIEIIKETSLVEPKGSSAKENSLDAADTTRDRQTLLSHQTSPVSPVDFANFTCHHHHLSSNHQTSPEA